MKRWRYKVLASQALLDSAEGHDGPAAELDRLGGYGWEIVAVTPTITVLRREDAEGAHAQARALRSRTPRVVPVPRSHAATRKRRP